MSRWLSGRPRASAALGVSTNTGRAAAAASQRPMAEPTGADLARARADATVLNNHHVVRDGSVWACLHCKVTWPFPTPVPSDPGPCVPRRWGDQ